MSKRINAIINYINNEDIVLDIGCDHALVGIELAKKGIYSYASDKKENIIRNAKEKVKSLGLEKYITFEVSNGLNEFDEKQNINTLILSGMGTHTIIKILKQRKIEYNKIITLSNNDHLLLRKEIIKMGYKIELEEIIFEKNKYYNLIVFTLGNSKYTEKEMYLGYNHQNLELLKEKNKYLISKYKYLINDIPETERKRMVKLLEMLED